MRTPHRRGNPAARNPPPLSVLLRVFLDIALLRSGPQVLCAVYGTSTILNLAMLPVVALVVADPQRFELVASFAQTLVLAWGLTILAHILHHALEQPLGITLLLSAVLLFLSLVAHRLLGLV